MWYEISTGKEFSSLSTNSWYFLLLRTFHREKQLANKTIKRFCFKWLCPSLRECIYEKTKTKLFIKKALTGLIPFYPVSCLTLASTFAPLSISFINSGKFSLTALILSSARPFHSSFHLVPSIALVRFATLLLLRVLFWTK